MPAAQVSQLDKPECEAPVRALGDTPETVTAVHQLHHGLCQAYAELGPGRHDAVVLRPSRPSDELVGFGPHVESLGRVLRGLPCWSCVCVEDDIALRLGPILEADLGRPIRDLMDINHTMERPVVAGSHPSVRYRQPILVDGRKTWVEVEEYDTNRGVMRDYDDGNDFEAYLAAGHGRTGLVGAARSYLFDAKDLTAFGVAWMERTFGVTSEGR